MPLIQINIPKLEVSLSLIRDSFNRVRSSEIDGKHNISVLKGGDRKLSRLVVKKKLNTSKKKG